MGTETCLTAEVPLGALSIIVLFDNDMTVTDVPYLSVTYVCLYTPQTPCRAKVPRLRRSLSRCVAWRTAATRALAFCRGPRFGFPTPTVQRSTEPLLRGKAPASPLTTAPAEMRQEVRPRVSFLAMPVAGRNRRVSTMGVYHRRPIRRAATAAPYRTRRALASWRRRDPPRRAIW